MKNILVTGGAGFIGSNFVKMMVTKYPEYNIVNIDNLTYAGNLENVREVEKLSNYSFIKGDIRNRDLIKSVFLEYNITNVINFAAESHVDKSIIEPDVFLTTNVLGTQVLLDVARNYWCVDSNNKYCTEYIHGVKFVQVSTDEVYGTLDRNGSFDESMPLLPNSPYSASKASADMIVRAYYQTYKLPVNISRCSNNYGPNQFLEKFIPMIITKCIDNDFIPIYGDGMQVRDWLYVSDHCEAIETILRKGIDGEIYNIGANNEKTNLEIAKLIINKLGKSENLLKYIDDRLGHDRRYSINNTKIINELGWKPKVFFEDGLDATINWYLNNEEWIENIVTRK